MVLLAPLTAMQPVHLSGGVVGSVLVLGAVGTGRPTYGTRTSFPHGVATNASTVTYLTPLVGALAVMLGIAILHESVSWNEPVGALAVMLGIAIGQGRFDRLRRAPSRADTGSPHPPDVVRPNPAATARRSHRALAPSPEAV